jgi:uncharacterized protein (DUF58 family)
MAWKYLRAEDLARLNCFEFAPKALAEGYLAGRHQSHRTGLSTEFRDHRPYSPGDDIKSLDWRVYARTERPYLRTFEIETSTDCHILLDSSASMGFGQPASKLDHASFFAAALCYLVVKNRDQVSLQIFDTAPREFFPSGSTNRHLHRILNSLETNRPAGQTKLGESLRRALPLVRRRGTLVIVSDFLDNPGEIFEALSPWIHRGFKIHLYHLVHPDEISLRGRGLTAFIDMETGRREIAHIEHLRTAYEDAFAAHLRSLRDLATRRQIRHVLARTDKPIHHLFDGLVR